MLDIYNTAMWRNNFEKLGSAQNHLCVSIGLDSLREKGVKSIFGLHPLTNSKGGFYTLQIHLNQVEILIPASDVEIPGQNDRLVPSTTGQIVIPS